jgi:RNA polymerase sigma factor (sigma-70 family)
MSDVDLVADEIGGTLEFEAFFRAEHERLFRTLVLVCGNRSEAEDIAQESMARAFERWDRVAKADSPAAYVYRIALNLNRRRLRRLALGRRRGQDLTPAQPVDPATTVQARAEARRALATLPVGLREALVLVEWVGLSAEEAARVLGIEAVSVRGRLHRARQRLSEVVGGEHDE